MGPIKEIPGFSPEVKKFEKNSESKKVDDRKDAGKPEKPDANSAISADRAEISSLGRDMLSVKTEAEKYLQLIRESRIADQEELDEIREKINSDYYLDPEVIEKIIDELMALPNFVPPPNEEKE